MYEESKEIIETRWKIWDILNDKEIINKVLLNSSLIDILNNLESNQNNSSLNQEENQIKINLDDIKYESHLKTISYRIESPILKNKNNDKSKSSDNNSIILDNTNESNEKQINDNKNYIKLMMILQPITIEKTELLTISMTDFSEYLNDNQLKDITQSIFNNFDEVIIKTVPLTKNCESIVINANINIVFDFWATWKIKDIGNELVSNLKMNGDPSIIGTKLNYIYFQKYELTAIVEEVNKYNQKGNEDDNNEWNYKYKITFKNGQTEDLNCIFISCENGNKTWVSAENNINDKIGIDKIQELSKRKLKILTDMKNYIEKNKESLTDSFIKSNK
jgi:hypothetical protein